MGKLKFSCPMHCKKTPDKTDQSNINLLQMIAVDNNFYSECAAGLYHKIM